MKFLCTNFKQNILQKHLKKHLAVVMLLQKLQGKNNLLPIWKSKCHAKKKQQKKKIQQNKSM